MTRVHELTDLLCSRDPPREQIRHLRLALEEGRLADPRLARPLAEAMGIPHLADFLALECAARLGPFLVPALKEKLCLASGDLPDAARLRALVVIQGAAATSVRLVAPGCARCGLQLARRPTLVSPRARVACLLDLAGSALPQLGTGKLALVFVENGAANLANQLDLFGSRADSSARLRTSMKRFAWPMSLL